MTLAFILYGPLLVGAILSLVNSVRINLHLNSIPKP